MDTLPEEKFVPTTPNPCTNDTNTTNASSNHTKDSYKRVYPDWKPSKTLDTDVESTIQAITGKMSIQISKVILNACLREWVLPCRVMIYD